MLRPKRRSTTSQNARKNPNIDIFHKPSKNVAYVYAWGRNKNSHSNYLWDNFHPICIPYTKTQKVYN
jgi:hypothetical protein